MLRSSLRPRRRRLLAYRLSRHSAQAVHAGLGGGLALLLVLWVSSLFVGQSQSALLVASMGASAVLLFSAPAAPLSQPWNLLGGQLVSALIGVSCARLLPIPWLAAACAVGLAIVMMALLGCTHPPGGATALSAVVGGPSVQAMGYSYVLTPVALNTLIIFLVALLFHGRSQKYPVRLPRPPARSRPRLTGRAAPRRTGPAPVRGLQAQVSAQRIS